jgi:hypothetical protein
MRTTRAVASSAAASEAAAGPLHTLQQCVHWLRQLNDTPVAEIGPEWVERGRCIRQCVESQDLKAAEEVVQQREAVKLPPAAEQQMLAVARLLSAAAKRLLLHLAQQKHPATPANKSPGSSSSTSSSSNNNSSTAGLEDTCDLLNNRLMTLGGCYAPLAASDNKAEAVYRESGEQALDCSPHSPLDLASMSHLQHCQPQESKHCAAACLAFKRALEFIQYCLVLPCPA